MSLSRYQRYLPLIATLFFLVHAGAYLYFFVDDEGIPFVYARNLLAGRGLTYATAEGHVEGYSNFLSVLVDSIILSVLRPLAITPLAGFAVGKFISLSAGAGLVYLVTRHLARAYGGVAASAGASALVLAGPLALWSCSSLEISSVALTLVVMMFALWSGRLAIGTAAAIALLLLRIDGPVWIAAATIAGLAPVSPERRLRIITRVGPAIVAAAALYHGWRYWYFGSLFSTPLQAKVLYKLWHHGVLAEKPPASNYLVAFAHLYGPLFLACGALGWIVFARSWKATGIFAAFALLCSYNATVGDWMFGFRFMVPALPLFALLVAETVNATISFSKVAGWIIAVAGCLWTTQIAANFMQTYGRPIFLRSPSLEPGRFFFPYWSLYTALKDRVPPGTLIAYNQAGFLPFMLDVENIDDLGICSRFFAGLPTRDLFFTEVGRYAPLTNKDVRTAGLSYLLYRQPAYLVEPADLLRKANFNVIPEELFGGLYRRIPISSNDVAAVYVPHDADLSVFRGEPRRFLENVAHIAHLARAMENGLVIPPAEYDARLGFLREGGGTVLVGRTYSLSLRFDTGDVPIYEVHVEGLHSPKRIEATWTLWSAAGVKVRSGQVSASRGTDAAIHTVFDEPVQAAQLTFDIASELPEMTRIDIQDLRIQGQPAALAAYLRQWIAFDP